MQITNVYKNTLLSGLILSLFFLLVISQQVFAQSSAQDQDSDIEVLGSRFTTELLESEINEFNIRNLMGSIQEDGSWPDINYEDTSRTAFEHSRT